MILGKVRQGMPGFAPRVQRSGRKHYIVQYRAGQKSRRINPGPGPPRVP